MPIQINLKTNYLSIGELVCPELPDFTLLTGRNGAGKTQLLKAINNGNIRVTGIDQQQIELYDMSSFHPHEGERGNWHSYQFARSTASDFIDGGRASSPQATAAAIFDRHIEKVTLEGGEQARARFNHYVHRIIENTPDFAVFPTERGQEATYQRELFDQVMAPLIPKTQRRKSNSRSHYNAFNDNRAALITMAMKLSRKLPHELTLDDIMSAAHFEGSTIENSISKVFATYKVNQYDWAHAQFEASITPVTFNDLIDQYENQNPPPWITLREVLASMREEAGEEGLFNFDFSDPADQTLNLSNYRDFSFSAVLTNRTSNTQYELDTLSSGEKVLMALCLASFNQIIGRRKPKLILLDELDAVLHPSMVRALVSALRTLFVEHGSAVMMTTHSPMTVAALPETEVFRVIRNDRKVQVVATTTTEAVTELSEGIATIDTGLRIAGSCKAAITILTEGNNSLHLKRWVELNFPSEVHVFDQLAEHRDKGQLLSYGRMLANMNPDSHFLVIWDCDAAEQAQRLREALDETAKVTAFAFERRDDNQIVANGIENMYDETILAPYCIKKIDSNAREVGREFQKNRKREFAEYVRAHGSDDYFRHFGKLRRGIEEILAKGATRSRLGES